MLASLNTYMEGKENLTALDYSIIGKAKMNTGDVKGAIDDFEKLGQFLGQMDSALGGTLSAFEVLWNDCSTLMVAESGRHGLPLQADHGLYVLLEATGRPRDRYQNPFESPVEQAFGWEL